MLTTPTLYHDNSCEIMLFIYIIIKHIHCKGLVTQVFQNTWIHPM